VGGAEQLSHASSSGGAIVSAIQDPAAGTADSLVRHNGWYSLKLTVEDTVGRSASKTLRLRVAN